MAIADLPLGDPVANAYDAEFPSRGTYTGQFVALEPVDVNRDLDGLYDGSHGDPEAEQLWTYMGYGPFANRDVMGMWLESCRDSEEPIFFAVRRLEDDRTVGMVSFSNISTESRRLEVGHIWYLPDVQRTEVNTETLYLMLCEAFDTQGYRRVEWKCDALNLRSRNAALRLGFSFEGTFKQHLIVKGRNRDTAWFAMLDGDWPGIKANIEKWLYGDEPDCSLFALNQPKLHRPFFV